MSNRTSILLLFRFPYSNCGYHLVHGMSAALLLAIVSTPTSAQVFGSGPSAPSMFETVVNLPPEPDISHNQRISGSTQINVGDGGAIASGLAVFSGTELNVRGGSVGRSVHAGVGSEVNILGGTVGDYFYAYVDSVVNISGGTVGSNFEAALDSEVNISGGTIGISFQADRRSDVSLIGDEFRLNGVNYSASTITLNEEDTFTGTLADGSPFIFFSPDSGFTIDELRNATLTRIPLPPLDTTPILVDSSVTGGISGLRPGQKLTLSDGGTLGDNFAVIDATMEIQGGTVGDGTEVAGSLVHITGGSVGAFGVVVDSEVNISGGEVGGFIAESNSVVNITGGSVRGFGAYSGSTVNISGGTIQRLSASSGSEVNIRGGRFGRRFRPFFAGNHRGAVNLFGTEFLLDDTPLPELALGQTLIINDRDITLSGTLADGSPFSIELNSTGSPAQNYLLPSATLSVTLVPEPSALMLTMFVVYSISIRRWC